MNLNYMLIMMYYSADSVLMEITNLSLQNTGGKTPKRHVRLWLFSDVNMEFNNVDLNILKNHLWKSFTMTWKDQQWVYFIPLTGSVCASNTWFIVFLCWLNVIKRCQCLSCSLIATNTHFALFGLRFIITLPKIHTETARTWLKIDPNTHTHHLMFE